MSRINTRPADFLNAKTVDGQDVKISISKVRVSKVEWAITLPYKKDNKFNYPNRYVKLILYPNDNIQQCLTRWIECLKEDLRRMPEKLLM